MQFYVEYGVDHMAMIISRDIRSSLMIYPPKAKVTKLSDDRDLL